MENEQESPKELIAPEPPVLTPAAASETSKPLPGTETDLGQTKQPEPVQVVKAPPTAVPEGQQPTWTEEKIREQGLKHCPICGSGPHDRVDLHFRWKHRERPPGNVQGKHKGIKPKPTNGAEPIEPAPTEAANFDDIEPTAQTRFTLSVPTAPTVNYAQMADMSFTMTTSLLSKIFGPEWQPQSEEEKAMVVKATADYFKSVEMPDIPPGYVLCFVCLAYAAPRLNAQPTKTKLQQTWLWFKSKFSRKRAPIIQLPRPAEQAAVPPTTKPPEHP